MREKKATSCAQQQVEYEDASTALICYELSCRHNFKATKTLADYAYTVALSGHRLTASESILAGTQPRTINRVYSYDSIYRLTGEQITGAELTSSIGYTHDAVGNRLSRNSSLAPVPSTVSTYDANDRLESDTYDANGNTTAATVRDTTSGNAQAVADQYDFEDHLISRNNGQIVIRYDGDGNRVTKTVGGVTTLYLVDERNPSGYAQVLEELTTTGTTLVVTRVYGYGSTLISQDQLQDDGQGGLAWVSSFYGHDGHGNIRYLTDGTGTVTDTYDYDAFGVLVAQSGNTPNNYLYCGEQFDSDLDLYYNRARYVSQDEGRFWSRDIFEGAISDPFALHRYVYAGADPVNSIDPSGEVTVNEVLAKLGIEADVNKTVNILVNQARKQATKKIGCEVAKTATVQGVYILVLGNGQWYVGQSKDIARRFGEHLRDLEKAGARIVGMLEITTGIKNARAAKYLREIFEAALIQKLNPKGNSILNPVANENRLTKYLDPVQAGVDKLFDKTPLCK